MILRRRIALLALAGVGTVGFAAGSSYLLAADAAAPKYTIEQAMKKGFKGKEKSLIAIVTSGKATAEQKKLMVELTEALAQGKPEKGELADWKKRTDAMAAAAKSIDGGDEKGVAALKAAANCKECHDLHKE